MHHATRAWQIAIDGRHAVAQHHLRALAQCFDNEGAAQRRADGVAIWPGMRAEHEGAALFDRLEYLFDHAYDADFSLPRAYPRGPRPRFETLPSLLDPLQQLFYSPFVLLRVVKIKEKFRHMAQ